MPNDLDRAYIINGDDLSRALSRLRIVIEEPEVSNSVHGAPDGWVPLSATGAPKYPEEVARAVLADAARPMEGRWPMTRGELETRLSLALEHTEIAAVRLRDGTSYTAGGTVPYIVVRAQIPGALAEELLADIDAQGDGDPETAPTREQLIRQAENGITVTRQALAGALRRIPAPPGDSPWWPHSQRLLLSILANTGCESCYRSDNGGSYPCNCPVACGARYCVHPLPGAPQVHPGNAVSEAVERCRAALSWLSPENRQRAVSALVGDVIKDGKPAVLPPRDEPDAEIAAMELITEALGALDGDAASRVLAYITARFGTGA